MKYSVVLKKSILKTLKKMPLKEQKIFFNLVEDLKLSGPVQTKYPNYSQIVGKKGYYHCHLSYRWVACWYSQEGTLIVEVQYVGSRESAPYK